MINDLSFRDKTRDKRKFPLSNRTQLLHMLYFTSSECESQVSPPVNIPRYVSGNRAASVNSRSNLNLYNRTYIYITKIYAGLRFQTARKLYR